MVAYQSNAGSLADDLAFELRVSQARQSSPTRSHAKCARSFTKIRCGRLC